MTESWKSTGELVKTAMLAEKLVKQFADIALETQFLTGFSAF